MSYIAQRMYPVTIQRDIHSIVRSLEPGEGEHQRDGDPSTPRIPGSPGLSSGEFLGWSSKTLLPHVEAGRISTYHSWTGHTMQQ